MEDLPLDAQERVGLCDLFEERGADAPTLLNGWTAKDLAAHIVMRERDLIAGPCLVLPGLFQRFAERRRARLTGRNTLNQPPPRFPPPPCRTTH
jgi:hypothetical protein